MGGGSRFERPVRPPHRLGGVPKVAPYSSRRHPPALPQEFGLISSPITGDHSPFPNMVGASRFGRKVPALGGHNIDETFLPGSVAQGEASRPVRPAHPLAGVPKVAPYSSRRHPSREVSGRANQAALRPDTQGGF